MKMLNSKKKKCLRQKGDMKTNLFIVYGGSRILIIDFRLFSVYDDSRLSTLESHFGRD